MEMLEPRSWGFSSGLLARLRLAIQLWCPSWEKVGTRLSKKSSHYLTSSGSAGRSRRFLEVRFQFIQQNRPRGRSWNQGLSFPSGCVLSRSLLIRLRSLAHGRAAISPPYPSFRRVFGKNNKGFSPLPRPSCCAGKRALTLPNTFI